MALQSSETVPSTCFGIPATSGWECSIFLVSHCRWCRWFWASIRCFEFSSPRIGWWENLQLKPRPELCKPCQNHVEPGYFHIIFILFSYYFHIIFILFSYYFHIIFILFSYYFHIIFILFSYYFHIIFILFSYYFHIIFILFSYYFHIIFIFHE